MFLPALKRNTHLTAMFSIPVKSGRSYFVDIQAPRNDKKSIELMRVFLHKHNWKAEVIPIVGSAILWLQTKTPPNHLKIIF